MKKPQLTGKGEKQAVSQGVVKRLVGNSLGYLWSSDGKTFSFTPDTIEQYKGESFSALGLKVNAPVSFILDSTGERIESVKLESKTGVKNRSITLATTLPVFASIPDQTKSKTKKRSRVEFRAAITEQDSDQDYTQHELHPEAIALREVIVDRALPLGTRRFGKLVDTSGLQAGDLVLTRDAQDRDRTSKIIAQIQREGGYSLADARWVHAAMYLGDGANVVEATIDHPLTGGDVRITNLDEYSDGSNALRFRRPKYVVKEQDGWRMCIRALSRLGEPYDLLQAVKLWIRVRINQRGFFEAKKEATSAAVVCSTLYADSYNQALRRSLGESNGICVPAWLSLSKEFDDVKVSWLKIRDTR